MYSLSTSAEPILKPFRLKSTKSFESRALFEENGLIDKVNPISKQDSCILVNNIDVRDETDNYPLKTISIYDEGLKALTQDKQTFLTFSQELIDTEGFIQDAMVIAPDIYWMENFPAVYYMKMDFLLQAMDCENFNMKVFQTLPKKITHNIAVMYKFFALDFLTANQFYFSSSARADRDEYQCDIYTHKNTYLGGLISLFALKDEVTRLNFDSKKGDNFSSYIYNHNGNKFLDKLTSQRHAWTKSYIVYGDNLCFDVFLEELSLDNLNAIKNALIGDDKLGLKTAKDLIDLVDDVIEYKSRPLYRRTIDGFKNSIFYKTMKSCLLHSYR